MPKPKTGVTHRPTLMPKRPGQLGPFGGRPDHHADPGRARAATRRRRRPATAKPRTKTRYVGKSNSPRSTVPPSSPAVAYGLDCTPYRGLHQVLQDQRQAEGEQEVVERVQPGQPVDERPAPAPCRPGPAPTGTITSAHQNGTPASVEQHVGAERAEHVEGAVGEVDHPQHAEDDRQPEGEQGVERPAHQAVEGVLEKAGHRRGHSLAVGATGRRNASAAGMVLSIFT